MCNCNKYNKVLISVVVATYRRDIDLFRSLQSLARQTYKSIEVIVVDDNADDYWNLKVLENVNRIRQVYSLNINYIKNEYNQGSAKTRNIGIKYSCGEYITFLDDDDVYLPEKIEKQLLDFIRTNADYGLTDLYLYNSKNILVDKRIRKYIKSNNRNDLLKYHLLYHMTGTNTFMFKKSYLLRIGGFSNVDIGDEFYLMQKAILEGGVFVYSNHCFVRSYIHTGEKQGLSSGIRKIQGENALFNEKQKFYSILNYEEIKYIEMRHYAVIAFAEYRRNNRKMFMRFLFKSLCTSPKAFITMCFNHIA